MGAMTVNGNLFRATDVVGMLHPAWLGDFGLAGR
jgi:hypothetical protein